MEKAGADFIIMTYNTAHYYFNEIQKIVNILLINMIQQTVQYIFKSSLLLKRSVL